jgi:hypothetical protein
MLLYRKLRYLYLKKHKHSESLIQDIIAKKTGFTAYEIVLYRKDSNHYTFKYRGIYYSLLNDKLNIISEDEI